MTYLRCVLRCLSDPEGSIPVWSPFDVTSRPFISVLTERGRRPLTDGPGETRRETKREENEVTDYRE